MSTPFIGEIQMFSFGYAPPGWAQCNGALVSIRDNPALFSLIGATYGGDGRDKFRLPNLGGRAACGQGTGTGLTQRTLGDSFGVNEVILTSENAPAHSHGINVFPPPTGTDVKTNAPLDGYNLSTLNNTPIFVKTDTSVSMGTALLGIDGGDLPHENRQPFLAMSFYIALNGNIPSFS